MTSFMELEKVWRGHPREVLGVEEESLYALAESIRNYKMSKDILSLLSDYSEDIREKPLENVARAKADLMVLMEQSFRILLFSTEYTESDIDSFRRSNMDSILKDFFKADLREE